MPLSIGHGELAATADAAVSVPEMFNYWIGSGRIQVAFLGAAQVDRHANLNSTVIGDYDHRQTRLPGAGGAPEIVTVDQVRDQTGWPLRVADDVQVTAEPTDDELSALRELVGRG